MPDSALHEEAAVAWERDEDGVLKIVLQRPPATAFWAGSPLLLRAIADAGRGRSGG